MVIATDRSADQRVTQTSVCMTRMRLPVRAAKAVTKPVIQSTFCKAIAILITHDDDEPDMGKGLERRRPTEAVRLHDRRSMFRQASSKPVAVGFELLPSRGELGSRRRMTGSACLTGLSGVSCGRLRSAGTKCQRARQGDRGRRRDHGRESDDPGVYGQPLGCRKPHSDRGLRGKVRRGTDDCDPGRR
jgi:hypothetical protein